MIALLNAARHPESVTGIVLVDPMNTRFIAATGDFVYSTVAVIPKPANDRERTTNRVIATFPGLVQEVARLEPTLKQPMVVITAGKPWWGRADIDSAWRRSHVDLVSAGVRRRLVVAEASDHSVPEDQPEVIVSAVRELLKRAR